MSEREEKIEQDICKHAKRIKESVLSDIAENLPKEIKYFVIINETAAYSRRHPKVALPEITALEIAKDEGYWRR